MRPAGPLLVPKSCCSNAALSHTTKRRKTKSDAGGLFRFDGNQSHALQLEAQAPGLGRSDRQVVRLWFRAQDTSVAEPLRLPGRQP